MLRLIGLGLRRFRSQADYQSMQRFIAENSLKELRGMNLEIGGKRVLEVGAGMGGYSQVLCEQASMFVAADLEHMPFFPNAGIPFIQFDATAPFPIADEQFDWIYCSSLIEHVTKPEFMLTEFWRVLRSQGLLYLTFPPFHSLFMIGGHQFKPFHLINEQLALKIYNRKHHAHIKSFAAGFGNYGLYPLRIDQVKALIQQSGFEIQKIYTRMSPFNTTRLPGKLKDLTTWHVCYVAKRR